MRLFSSLFALFAMCSCVVFAQSVEVALSPSYVFSHTDLNVLCVQIDRNFDGVQDEDDNVASWWKVNAAGEASLVREFAWGDNYLVYPFGFPVRPGFSQNNDTVFLYVNNGVTAFDVATGDSIGRLEVGAQVSGMYWQPDGTLFCSVRGETNTVQAYNWALKMKLGEYAVVDFPQQIGVVKSEGTTWIAVLSEGSWGESGSMQFINTSTFEISSIAVDPLPNSFLAANGSVYAVVNGISEVWEINPATAEIVRRITVSEASQPRDLTYHEGRMYVSSYDGGVGVYDAVSGDYIGSAATEGRVEASVWHNGGLWVANTYETGTFTPFNKVQKLDLTTDVEMANNSNVSTFPNPSTAGFDISLDEASHQETRVRLYDLAGTLVGEVVVEPLTTSVSFKQQLPAGVYMIVAGSSASMHVVE